MNDTQPFFHKDPSSYYETGQPRMTHVSWDFNVDLGAKVLSGVARYTFERGGEVTLDTNEITIESVTDGADKPVVYTLGAHDAILGAPLKLVVPNNHPEICIRYRTKEMPGGLLWLTPKQTHDGKHPFVFSQGETILTRTFLPCQDTPGIKFTYDARITVPGELRGVMSADVHVSRGAAQSDGRVTEEWKMTKPIPAYLVAFAVGDIAVQEIDKRVSVYAEPGMVAAVAAEFVDVPKMIDAAEEIFGIPYDWGPFDPFVLPRGFPWGGMENPCRPFLTPALVVGDKSNVSTVAHELAHSWAGNRVTNSTWSDFWLNEGLTTYVEHRIVEKLYGVDDMELEFMLLSSEYYVDMERFKETPDFATLTPSVEGVDPESAFSRVPYYKGALFWFTLEAAIGREKLDRVLQNFMNRFAFKSVSTEQLLDFLVQEVGRKHLKAMKAWEWMYGIGLPDTAPVFKAVLAEEPRALATSNTVPSLEAGQKWGAAQWGYYLATLSRTAPTIGEAELTKLAQDFKLMASPNPDVAWAFLQLAVDVGSAGFNKDLDVFLSQQGRKKYLLPLYRSLSRSEQGRVFGREVFARAKDGYHPVVAKEIEHILAGK